MSEPTLRFTPASVDCLECANNALTYAGLDLTDPFLIVSGSEGKVDPRLIESIVSANSESKIFLIISSPIIRSGDEKAHHEGPELSDDEPLTDEALREILGVEDGADEEDTE